MMSVTYLTAVGRLFGGHNIPRLSLMRSSELCLFSPALLPMQSSALCFSSGPVERDSMLQHTQNNSLSICSQSCCLTGAKKKKEKKEKKQQFNRMLKLSIIIWLIVAVKSNPPNKSNSVLYKRVTSL